MRVRVGDTLLDQFNDTIIAQNYEANDFGDLTTRNGGFSNDFTLPLSATNRQALDFPDDINNAGRNPYQKVSAELVDTGAVISKGYLRYKIVTDNEISCAFFSDNTEWFNLIKDKKLRELDLSAYDHVWDKSVIKTAIDADKSSGYTYPIIDYGYYIGATLDTSGATVVYTGSMFPAMFVSTLVSQIFTDIGWSVAGDLLTEERYTRMIQPFSAEEFVHSDDFVSDSTIADTEDATPTLVGVGNQNVDWTSAGGETISITNAAAYNVAVVLNVTQTGEGNGTLKITKNGSDVQTKPFAVTGPIGQLTLELSEPVICAALDIIRVNVSIDSVISGSPQIQFDTGTIDIYPSGSIRVGDEIQMSATMPDISQADFLKYIFFAFGVVPQANNFSNVVTLSLFNTIKDNIPSALDWSDKLDTSKKISMDFTQLLNNYSRVSIVNYEEDDNDPELSAYKAETTKNFGQGQFDISNEHLDPEKEIYTAPYTPMININSFNNSLYIPQIKFYIEDPDAAGTFIKEFDPKPKIALLSSNIDYDSLTLGEASTWDITNEADLTGATVSINDVPFCWFVKTEFITAIDSINYSLAFDPTVFPNESGATLLTTYAAEYEELLNNMKYIKAFFTLSEVDINNLDFKIPIYIDRFKAYFYLNKIKNYQGSERATQVELIKIDNGG